MTIAQSTKVELRDKIEKLKAQKHILTKKIQELKDRHDKYVASRVTIQANIDQYQSDIDNN